MPKRHIVRLGDCVASIGYRHGFHPDTLEAAPENAELMERRGTLYQVVEGDVLFIPDRRDRTAQCAVDRVHRFRRRGVPERFRQRFLDCDGEARAGLPFEATIGLQVISGRTDGDGAVDLPISPDLAQLELVLGEGPDAEHYTFDLGHLPPAASPRGVKHRLAQLSRYDGPIDDEMDERLRAAVRQVQAELGLDETGELDAITVDEISAWYEGGDAPDSDL